MPQRTYSQTTAPYTLRSIRRSPLLIILASLTLVYLATLTADYYWDGITFALQIEKVSRMDTGVGVLFYQNHLLYTAIGSGREITAESPNAPAHYVELHLDPQ